MRWNNFQRHNLTTHYNYRIVMLKNVLTFMFHTIEVQILSQLDKNPVSQTIKKIIPESKH